MYYLHTAQDTAVAGGTYLQFRECQIDDTGPYLFSNGLNFEDPTGRNVWASYFILLPKVGI